MRLDGVGLFVNDMKKMIQFYRDVLGFEIKEDDNAGNVYLIKDGTVFMLYRRNDFEKMTNKNAIFLRIVAKFVKVPFYVQHFKDESLEYLVSARYPLCISIKHSWTAEVRSSSSSCAPASISSSMTRLQQR